jgi:hypothetical protein
VADFKANGQVRCWLVKISVDNTVYRGLLLAGGDSAQHPSDVNEMSLANNWFAASESNKGRKGRNIDYGGSFFFHFLA